jgi:hypothetical protein
MGNDSRALTTESILELPFEVEGTRVRADYDVYFDKSAGQFKRTYANAATAGEIDAVADASAGAVTKISRIAFGATELGGSETNTTFTFPASGAILLDAWIYVADAEGGGSMDVGTQGTSNDPDGILDGISLASTGWVFPTATLTTGLNGQYISATTFGALTHHIDLGTDDDGDSGFIFKRGVFITGADPVSITSSGDLNSCSGYLFLKYIELGSVA